MIEIKHQTFIRAQIDEVYKILTTAEGWNSWFTNQSRLYLHADGTGEIKLKWTNFGSNCVTIEDGGKILEAIPNKSFVFQWSPGENITTVSFKLENYNNGTLLKLIETGYSPSTNDIQACIECASGWGEALTLLKVYIEHGLIFKKDII